MRYRRCFRGGFFCLLILIAVAVVTFNMRQKVAAPSPTPPKAGEHVSVKAEVTGKSEALGRFAQWAESYGKSAQDVTVVDQGAIELARQRRDALREMIQEDPQQALEWAVPLAVRRQLPAAVEGLLEERISARGDYAVLAALPLPGKESEVPPIQRSATIGGKEYRAFVYGQREELPTRKNVPLHGIAIDDVVALSDKGFRDLEDVELKDLNLVPGEALCAVSQEPAVVNNEPSVVDVGGEIVWLCSYAHRDQLNQTLMASAGELGGGDVAESPYTEGRKRLIMIRVAFSNLPTPDISSNQLVTVHAGVDTYWRINSYGKTSAAELQRGSEIVQVTLANTYQTYDDNAGLLRTDVRAAATAQGIDFSRYDFDIIYTGGGRPAFSFGGLGYVGAPGSWVVGASRGITAHELGHNLNFPHANFWDTGGQSAIGPGGNQEYGDPFDVMGSGGIDDGTGPGHYVSKFKWRIGWIEDEDFPRVTQSGTYRIYTHDNPDATGLRGIRFPKDGSLDYYLEFRQRYTGNPWLMNGIGLRWGSPGGTSSQLIDTTPGTGDGKNDSAIVIGRTFTDPQANVHITPVAKGNTYPESMDVVLNFGTFASNQPPRLLLLASSQTAALNSPVTFTAEASDPNGDTLAYHWDFGDNTFSPSNAPAVAKSWGTAGEYLVRCTVSDMKGRTVSDSVIVRVGTPAMFQVSGRVLSEGQPVAGVLVRASSTRFAYTDTDGTYTITRLTSGSYTITAQLYPYIFANPFFQNPISVGPNRSNLDFVSVSTPLSGTDLVASNSVWSYLDNGSNQGTNWVLPDFDDVLWPSGPAQLGYGDGDEATVIGFGPNSNAKYITSYFRQAFQVADPAAYTNFGLTMLRDDGAVVYLNGVEVLRDNMPAGTITYSTPASASSEATITANVPSGLFVTGRNVIAVEVHQNAGNSSDLSFQLSLGATAVSNINDIALVYLASPADGAIYRGATNITLTANAFSTTTSFNLLEFYANGAKVGESTAAPYSTVWSAPQGTHVLRAVGRDSASNSYTSAPVNITVLAPAPLQELTFVPTGAVWKYSADGTDHGTNWLHPGFDDGGWPAGPSQLGYGEGDEATAVPSGQNTAYFRHEWYVAEPLAVSNLTLNLLRDDGAVVYLNGAEIYRNNMPVGPVNFATRAFAESEGTSYFARVLNPRSLLPGVNLLAVEVHQFATDDADMSFDLELVATVSSNRPPGVYITEPDANTSLVVPDSLEIAALAVPQQGQGIQRVTFYANGSLLGEVPSTPFVFEWSVPPIGTHQLTAVALQTGGQSFTSAPVQIQITAPPAGEQLVSLKSAWRYLDDGSDQGTAWRGRTFNDSGWAEGYARLGYGGDGESTVVSYGNNAQKKHVTTWFRRKFNITSPAAFSGLKLLLSRDDGAVVYLNGLEVYRNNLRAGQVSYNSLALTAVDGTGEQSFLEASLPTTPLVSGENVIAVEIHQASITSSDLGFDLALVGERGTNLVQGIYLTAPGQGAHLTLPGSLDLGAFVRFPSSPALTRVDFLANGTKIGEATTAPFGFTWSNPAIGSYSLTAVAQFSGGASVASPSVSVTVGGPPIVVSPVFQTFINSGATWAYWPNASAAPTNWTSPAYNDAAWPEGPARLGFGLDGEVTTLTAGRSAYYFRNWFTVTNPALLDRLILQLQRDDGAVVYINGTEVLRHNMPGGNIGYTTLASAIAEGLDEQQFFIFTLPASGILAGENLIAVEVHQASDSRLDLGFDLHLSGAGDTAPRVLLARPVNGSSFLLPATVQIDTLVWPGQGRTVSKVEFLVDDTKVGEVTSAPYSFTWQSTERGVHVVRARAIDNFGSYIESDPANVALGIENVTLTLVPSGATWRYLDNGSNQGTNWTRLAAPDSFWKVGPARLGYGGDGEVTVVSYGPSSSSKYITTYFRQVFNGPTDVTITNLNFRLVRDDGAVVWFNGVEVFRSNMPTGPIAFNTLAVDAIGGADETTFFPTSVAITNLAATNIVAVEIHQNAGNSSDLGFDLELVGTGYRLQAYVPEIAVELLPNGYVAVSWDAAATGWQLYYSDQLGAGAVWNPLPGPAPTLQGNRRVVEFLPSPGARFFRLRETP